MKDTDLMPFGIHKGKAMANVPADYLMFIYRVTYNNQPYERFPVSIYIHENLDALKLEIKNQGK